MPHPRKALLGEFVGAEKCGTCHEAEYDAWKKTGHARATQTLVKLDPPRQFDPECLACHVTGWHAQSCFPYESGYLGLQATPKLIGVGCENCHGPGGAHAAAEIGANKARQEEQQAAIRLTQADAKRLVCVRCHDANDTTRAVVDGDWTARGTVFACLACHTVTSDMNAHTRIGDVHYAVERSADGSASPGACEKYGSIGTRDLASRLPFRSNSSARTLWVPLSMASS